MLREPWLCDDKRGKVPPQSWSWLSSMGRWRLLPPGPWAVVEPRVRYWRLGKGGQAGFGGLPVWGGATDQPF